MAKLTPEERRQQKHQVAQTFLADVLSRVPAEQRETIKAAMTQPEVLDLVGDGVLRQQDYSRGMQAIQQRQDALVVKEQVLSDWWKGAEGQVTAGAAAVAELAALKARMGDGDDPPAHPATPPARPPVVDLSGVLTRDEAQRTLQALEENSIQLSTMLVDLSERHRDEFGKSLDRSDLIAFARDNGLRLDVAYDRYVAGARDQKREADLTERLRKAREEGALEERQRLASVPYPSPDGSAPNIFGHLAQTGKPTVEDAARELRQLHLANQ